MNVTVTMRHQELPSEARDYATDKTEGLTKYFDHLTRGEVVLDGAPEGKYKAELIIHGVRGHVFVCHAVGDTVTAAIDKAHDKMEHQLTKFKDKLRGNSGKEAARATRRLERRTKRVEMSDGSPGIEL